MRIVNLELLKNPYNWIVVYLMVGFAVAALTLANPMKVQQSLEGN